MKYLLLGCIIFCASLSSSCSASYQDLSPEAQEVIISPNLVKIKTKHHTFITIDLNANGEWEEISGVNLNRGDEFFPGQGLLSLKQVEKRMFMLGKKIYGRWRLIKYQQYGWVYQVNAQNKTQQTFLMLNAYSGHLIGELAQLPPLNFNKRVAKDYK